MIKYSVVELNLQYKSKPVKTLLKNITVQKIIPILEFS